MSRADLGAAVGVSESYIGMLENGSRAPSIQLAFKLAEVLGAKPGDLFEHLAPFLGSTDSN